MGKSSDKLDGQVNDVTVNTEKVSGIKTEESKHVEAEAKNQNELSNSSKIFTSLAAGGIAGGIAKTVIAPLDR